MHSKPIDLILERRICLQTRDALTGVHHCLFNTTAVYLNFEKYIFGWKIIVIFNLVRDNYFSV